MKETENQRWLVVANPTSGGGKVARQWAKIEQALTENGIAFEARLTTKRREATDIVRRAIADEGFRRIIGVGGDGTCHEIVNGIFQQKTVETSAIQYTMFAAGTGNDWVKMHAIPSNLTEFCPILLRGRTETQDVGMIEFSDKNGVRQREFFANAGGLGYDSFVVQSVENDTQRLVPKRYSYFLHILKCLFRYKAERVRVSFHGQNVDDKFYTINFGINKFSGAGMQLTPQAVKNDGLLALTLIREIAWWKVILQTPRLYSGSVGKLREATLFNVKTVHVASLGVPIHVETDGEFLGATPVDISILENALTVVVAQ